MAFGTKGEETMACGGLLKENRLHAEPFLGVIVFNEEVYGFLVPVLVA